MTRHSEAGAIIPKALRAMASLALAMACSAPRDDVPNETGMAPVSGGQLYYEVKGTGPIVVLLQGGQLDLSMWDDQMDAFAREFRVLRYDARGFGRSTPRSGPFAAHEDFLELLRHLRIERASLVGLSYGGGVALDFALEHPEMVERLVLVGPGISGFAWSDQREPWVDSAFAAYETRDSVRMALLWLQSEYMKPAMRRAGLARRLRDLTVRNASIWVQPDSERVLTPPAISRMANVRAPTLLILGTADARDIHRIVDTLARTIPNARKATIDSVGHMVNMEAPAEFNRLVLEFLRSPSGRGR